MPAHLPAAGILFSDAAQAVRLSERLSRYGLAAILVGSSDELFRLLREGRLDAVVIDSRQRGFFSGLEVVERLAADLARPVTLLVGTLTSDEQRRAAKLRIDRVVPRCDDPDAIVEALRAALLVATQSGVLVASAARSLVLRNDAIQPLPRLLIKLARYLDDETGSVADLARDISADARVTAELLKLTNSASMGVRGKVARVLDAVNLLGIRRTVSLVISATVQRAQRETFRHLPEELQNGFRIRSVLTAGTAATFARQLKTVCSDSAQILGLLQDLGILVLAQARGDRYRQMLSRVRTVPALRLDHCEDQEYGFTHADVSAALLQKWQLPNSIVSLVLDHHKDLNQCGRPPAELELLRVMQIGEAVADLKESPSPQRHRVLSRLLEPFGGTESSPCRATLAEAIAWTRESFRLFEVPAPEEGELTLVLPDCPDESAETAAQTADASEPYIPDQDAEAESAQTVLVIDDDAVAAEILTAILESLELRVRCCATGAEAQTLVRGVSAVLCDVHLGTENGIDIVRDLRQRGVTVPMIAISGDRTRKTIADLLAAGIDDYIVKPFDRRVVIEKIRRHIRPGAGAGPQTLPGTCIPTGSESKQASFAEPSAQAALEDVRPRQLVARRGYPTAAID